MKNNLSRFLFILGLIFIFYGGFLFWKRVNPNRLSFNNFTQQSVRNTKKGTPTPTRLIIKDLHIDLPVIPQKIVQGKWETTENGVSYLIGSSWILYGHDFANLLGNLKNAKPKMTLVVNFSNQSVKKFVITNTMEVYPTQTQVLAVGKSPVLIIYTCSGFFDEKRFVVAAKPV